MNTVSRSACMFMLAAACLSCSGDERPPSVPPAPEELPRHLRELRAKQRLRFSVDGVWKETELTLDRLTAPNQGSYGLGNIIASSELSDFIAQHCARVRWEAANPGEEFDWTESQCNTSNTLRQCSVFACVNTDFVCVSNTLLEISSGMSTKKILGYEGEEIEIPPQSIEVRAAMAEATELQIYGALHTMMYLAAETITQTSSFEFGDCTESMNSDLGPTVGMVMANSFIELHELSVEASRAAADMYVAIASNERNSQSSSKDGAAAANVIRQHASHLLSGGRNFDETTLGACTQPELSPGGSRALEILRVSAVDPVRVLRPLSGENALTMPSFMNNEDIDGVCYRYAARTRQSTRFDAKSAAGCVRELGLTMSDFQEARAYLGQEIVAFGRSLSQVVAGETIEGIACDPTSATSRASCIFASTSKATTGADWSFYTGLQRADGPPGSNFPSGGLNPVPALTARTLSLASIAMFTSDILTQLSGRIRRAAIPEGESEPDAWAVPILDRLERGISTVGTTWSGIASYYPVGFPELPDAPGVPALPPDWETAPTHIQLVFAAETASPTTLIAVRSNDAVQCATTGLIEGVPCTQIDLRRVVSPQGVQSTIAEANLVPSAGVPDEILGPVDAPWLDSSGSYYKFASISDRMHDRAVVKWSLPAAETTVYILELRPGSAPRRPGSYRSVTAVPVRLLAATDVPAGNPPSTAARRVDPRFFPIAEAYDRRAGEILVPSVDWCTTHQETCAPDLDDGGPIPLEDPVSENGTNFEDSWRHYLADARRLADHADRLGERILDSQAAVDRIAEQSLIRVSQICGVEAPLGELIEAAKANPGKSPMELLDILVTDGDADVEVQDLHACLSENAVDEYVSLGRREVCAWRSNGDSGELCAPAATGEAACPYIKPENGTCGDAPTGATMLPTSAITRLGVLEPVEFDIPQGPSASMCRDLRTLRRSVSPTQWHNAYQRVFGPNPRTGVFSQENLSRFSELVAWHASNASFSSLSVAGATVFATGDARTGTSTSGACAPSTAMHPGGTCDGWVEGSLLCTAHDCAQNGTDALNTRLFRAASRARWLGHHDLVGFTIPSPSVYYADTDPPYSISASLAGPNAFVGQTASAGGLPGTFVCSSGVTTWMYNPIRVTSAGVVGPFPVNSDCNGESTTTLSLWTPKHDTRPYGTIVSETQVMSMIRSASYFASRAVWSPYGMRFFQAGIRIEEPGFRTEFGWEPVFLISAQGEDLAMSALAGIGGAPGAHPSHIEELFDALELICEAGAKSDGSGVTIPDEPTIGDMPVIASAMERAAAKTSERADAMIIEQLPVVVRENIEHGSGVVTADSSGLFAAESVRMASAILQLQKIPHELASQVAGLARDLRALNEAIERIGYARDGARAQLDARMAEQSAACGRAMTSLVGASASGGFGFIGSVASAGMACETAAELMDNAQAQYAATLGGLESESDTAVSRTAQTAATRADALFAINHRITTAMRELKLALVQIESLREEGGRELSRAMFLTDPTTEFVFQSGGSMRNRLSLDHQRYQRAKRDALKGAFLAKRSIEQRFGLRLASMTRNLSRVDAPATWESQLCTMEGFDFDAIRNGVTPPSTAGEPPQYIGDYISNLELLVESYSRDFPLQEGSDTAVISLRDDIMNVRDTCDMPVENRFYNSGDMRVGPEGSTPGWQSFGCRTDPSGRALPQCVTAAPITDGSAPAFSSTSLGAPRPFRLTFNEQHPQCPGESCPCDGPDSSCGWQEGARYGQDARVQTGWHRFSFYVNYCSISGLNPQLVMSGVSSGIQYDEHGFFGEVVSGSDCWMRLWMDIDVRREEMLRITMGPGVDSYGMAIDTAGWQLERIAAADANTGQSPRTFAETRDTLTHESLACEDTDGDVFRSAGWTRVCERLCPTGWGVDCASEARVQQCFFETQFSLSNRAIEAGEVLARSGFALGNYNYRNESLAVNFVGSAARQCTSPELPSTCYNSGFIQYSLDHVGPYVVRNHEGGEYVAPLFVGRIVGAKGLATERYISNPISGSDDQLLSQFTQTQFRGRPITGTYRFRVYDAPGVNFDGIEDVQLVLRYRFWTRND